MSKDQKPEVEIDVLNADALDVEELERRMEMAISIMDFALYCGVDCGHLCGANCGSLCAANCSTLCGVNVCSTNGGSGGGGGGGGGGACLVQRC